MIKKTLIIIAIIAGLTVYAWLEYSWCNRVMSNNSEGWTLVTTRKSDWAFLKPWTWFKAPIGSVLYAETGVFGKLNDQYYYAHTLTHTRGEEDFGTMDIIDIKNEKFAMLKTLGEFQSLSLDKLQKLDWYTYSSSSLIFDLSEFLKKNVKTYYATDPFGNEIDVTNYIASGNYTVESGNNDHVFALTNKKPYEILKNDLTLIEKELNNWLTENGEYESPNNKLKIDKIRYLHSQQMLLTMTDVFCCEIHVKKENVDTALNFEFTFSNLYYPDHKSENKVILFDNEE